MKKAILAVAITLIITGTASAGRLTKDDNMNPIQGPAYDGSKSAALTVASTIVDLSRDVSYAIYTTASNCFERFMPSASATKSSYVKTPIPSDTWHTAVVNSATPFGNFSGCTGYIKRQ